MGFSENHGSNPHSLQASIGHLQGSTSGQITLAWVLAQGKDATPTPGTTGLPVLRCRLHEIIVRGCPVPPSSESALVMLDKYVLVAMYQINE